MRQVTYIGGTVLVSGLSGFGAAELALGLGLGPELATLACIPAFLCNFFMIEPIEDIVRR
jgi:predicted cobalt transporter CbtA